MSLHTIERIDIKDKLPRNGSFVLCWGHLRSHGWRWIDVLKFEDGRFHGDIEEVDEGDWVDDVTHWAPLDHLTLGDGLPLHRSFNQ